MTSPTVNTSPIPKLTQVTQLTSPSPASSSKKSQKQLQVWPPTYFFMVICNVLRSLGIMVKLSCYYFFCRFVLFCRRPVGELLNGRKRAIWTKLGDCDWIVCQAKSASEENWEYFYVTLRLTSSERKCTVHVYNMTLSYQACIYSNSLINAQYESILLYITVVWTFQIIFVMFGNLQNTFIVPCVTVLKCGGRQSMYVRLNLLLFTGI